PPNCAMKYGTVPVWGYVSSPSGTLWSQLYIGAGYQPSTWFQLTGTVNQPVNGGTIYNLNTLNYADGLYQLRLVATDPVNGRTSEERNEINIRNVFIQAPTGYVTGPTTVIGGAAGSGFSSYMLDWAPGCGAQSGFNVITSSNSPVTGIYNLGNWNING